MARDWWTGEHAHAANGADEGFSLRLRSRFLRVAVAGHSMEPALQDGDWLLVDPAAYVERPPEPGELVVARDPRAPDRLIVKRVALQVDGVLSLAGDHPAHAHEAAEIGPVALTAIIGRPWLRYWPPRRMGLLRRHV